MISPKGDTKIELKTHLIYSSPRKSLVKGERFTRFEENDYF
jgi:hypothetical protein